MFKKLLDEWLETDLGKTFHVRENVDWLYAFIYFVAWLDMSAAQLLRAPAPDAIELLRTIQKAIDENMAVDFNEISANIDAVLKTASGG